MRGAELKQVKQVQHAGLTLVLAGLTVDMYRRMYVCMYVRIYLCVCVCVCVYNIIHYIYTLQAPSTKPSETVSPLRSTHIAKGGGKVSRSGWVCLQLQVLPA